MQVPAARVVFGPEERSEIARLIDGALQSGSLTLGPLTARFEAAFAERHHAAHAIAVSSGTAALEIILRSLDVAGREVVVPANTFYATAGAVIHAGAVPVFADVSAETFALTPESVEPVLTERTAAVILVHIGGIISPEVTELRAVCDRRGIHLIEDAAHAHGSSLDGRSAGSFGTAGAFSFYPTKVVTAGEGGMIVTGDTQIRDDAIVYHDQGKASFAQNDHAKLGYAWRMSELSAAVGVVHLGQLDDAIERRRSVARAYDEGLAGLDVQPLREVPGGISNYYKYIVVLPRTVERDQLKKRLKEEHGVSLSGEVYATPLHQQSVLAPYATGPLPVSEDVCARHVCLPVHSDMSTSEADYVVASFTSVYRAL